MTSAAFHFDAQASLVKKAATASSVVALNLDSTAGVQSAAWSVSAADGSSAVADWVVANANSITGATVTCPSGSGKACIVRCVVNGGTFVNSLGQTVVGDLVKTAKIYIAPEVGCAGEQTESHATYGTAPILNALLRGTAPVNMAYSSSGTPTLASGEVRVLSGTVTAATLPAASTMPGQATIVKKDNLAGAVTISRSGSDTIDGATSYSLTGNYGTVTFIADLTAAKWYAFPAA